MGRSVSVPYDAEVVAFKDVTEIQEDWQWSDFINDLQDTIQYAWKSFEEVDKWVGNEDHAIMENQFVQIGISEYCGLASIWVRPVAEDHLVGLAEKFCEQIEPKFKQLFSDYVKLGSMSNGEGVYQHV